MGGIVRAAILLVLVVIISGCLNPELAPPSPTPLDSTGIFIDGDVGPLSWTGPELSLTGQKEDRRSFDITVPEGYWENRTGSLVVSIRWPLLNGTAGPATNPQLDFALFDSDGALVANGVQGKSYATPYPVVDRAPGTGPINQTFLGASEVVVIDTPETAAYTMVVEANRSNTAYQATVHVQTRDAGLDPQRDFLPNLVALPPNKLSVWHPGGVLGTGVGQCSGFQETPRVPPPQRCLRFGLAVGNIGEGSAELRLSTVEGAKAQAGLGDFVQRIYRADGSYHDEVVGKAEFHHSHRHYHYSGSEQVDLYLYDLEADERGAKVKDFQKTGRCFEDLSLVHPGATWTTLPNFNGRGCSDPTFENAWVLGLSPNWYDLYPANYPDQYVEISGVADGVYELAIKANGDGQIRETSKEDNEASTVFRLAGDKVEILKTFSVVSAPP